MLVGYPQTQGATAVDLETALKAADCVISSHEQYRSGRLGCGCAHRRENPAFSGSLKLAKPGTPFLIGMAKPKVKAWVQEAELNLVELGELDELAILNAVPTAEGAVQLAMEKLPITISGASCAVLGFGRCGSALARLLSAMGAETTVAARRPSQLALAKTWDLPHAVYMSWRKKISSLN